jgi:hypothetical protein
MAKPIILVDHEQEIELPDEPFQVIVYDQGINIEAPQFIQITKDTVFREIDIISEDDWNIISSSELFKILWYEFFEAETCATKIPITAGALRKSSEEQRFIAGFIILLCESHFQEKNPFIKTPETVLKPACEQKLISAINLCRAMLGGYDHMLDADIEYALAKEKAKEGGGLSAHEEMRLKLQAQDRLQVHIQRNLSAFDDQEETDKEEKPKKKTKKKADGAESEKADSTA